MRRNPLFLRVGFGVLILAPVLAVYFFEHRIKHYEALLEKYECDRRVCEADFDGDGRPGTLSIDRTAPAPKFDSWFVIVDSGKELLREPRRSIDNSLKTHAAVIAEAGVARVIIYDHIFDHGTPRSLVFAYDGKSMVKVSPSEEEREVLAAIEANDETGTFEKWVLFRLLVIPGLVFYYLVLGFVAFRVFWKRD
jgi:hypothetical protein